MMACSKPCLISILFVCATVVSAQPSPGSPQNFNRDWLFVLGQQRGAEAIGFDDSDWRSVRLPHDWAISGPFQSKGDPNTGKLPWRGEGWYRKHFSLPSSVAGKRVYLDFDGAMAMPTVYVNGKKAGGWDYGYISFRVDATDYVIPGRSNMIAVHLDTRSHNSRWYPGAGLYRKVQLVISDPVHIAHWGTWVTTPDVSDTSATVRVQTLIENHDAQEVQIELETSLLDPAGVSRGKQRVPIKIGARTNAQAEAVFIVPNPHRWDVERPRLYSAVSRVLVGRKLVDSLQTRFGIRTFQFTANDGFHLNGRRVQLKGVNLHHDHGPLGAAFHRRAMERQLQIMKDMGVNALRTSHNPPAPELLDLCDEMGLVVWNEAFDKWDSTSTRPRDESIADFNRRQIQNFVRRDRNHPSVVLWSVGNEIWDLENGKLPDSPGLLRQMVGFFKELDPYRPVTLAHAVPESANTPLDDSLDVTGWNYARRYAVSRERRPQMPIVYSESASALSTRGHYALPHPAKKDDFSTSLRLSSYDHNSASWSDLADTEFALMEKDTFVAGEFVWTGFDYLGEPTPFIARGWGAFTKRSIAPEEESRSSLFGIVDLAGIPKDRFYLYRSYWAPEKTTIHILPHWTWPGWTGSNVPVYVYTSGDSAELFLNGASLGTRTKQPKADNVMDRYRLRWEQVTYQPGELKAVAYSAGRKLGEARVVTAGEPEKLRLTPDRETLRAGGEDLAYLLVEAVDSRGNLCSLATDTVVFTIKGPASIAGVANGDHHFPADFVADSVDLFYGKAVMVLRDR
jgi:beta-galactosidase